MKIENLCILKIKAIIILIKEIYFAISRISTHVIISDLMNIYFNFKISHRF